MAQQTAVEWLVKYIIENFHLTDESLSKFEQAKAMEKEQIVDAYQAGATDLGIIESQEYYNETYQK
jgi:hypothetical protein